MLLDRSCWALALLLAIAPARAGAQSAVPLRHRATEASYFRVLWRHLRPDATCYQAASATTAFGGLPPDSGRFTPQLLLLSPRPLPGEAAPSDGGAALVRIDATLLHPARWQRRGDSLQITSPGGDSMRAYHLRSEGDTLRGEGSYHRFGPVLARWPVVAVRTACPEH